MARIQKWSHRVDMACVYVYTHKLELWNIIENVENLEMECFYRAHREKYVVDLQRKRMECKSELMEFAFIVCVPKNLAFPLFARANPPLIEESKSLRRALLLLAAE